ncbi:DUF6932 family protein [Microbacterium caowuchunii]|uniref:DUF6932 family protein n=1 Tax=Microbacterium caowuchunii TaxID=2614638 RepID=UPI0037CC0F50
MSAAPSECVLESTAASQQSRGAVLIPALTASGHLPPGRHPAALDDVRMKFVDAFPGSTTRSRIWNGFLRYLRAWDDAEHTAGVEVLHGVWIAGSFTTSISDPSDIDVSPIYDKPALLKLQGRPGSGKFRALIEHRARIVDEYMVEPFAVPWVPVESTLLPDRLPPLARDALATRGGLDSWWGRVRPPGAKTAPTLQTRIADRGYLEVVLR